MFYAYYAPTHTHPTSVISHLSKVKGLATPVYDDKELDVAGVDADSSTVDAVLTFFSDTQTIEPIDTIRKQPVAGGHGPHLRITWIAGNYHTRSSEMPECPLALARACGNRTHPAGFWPATSDLKSEEDTRTSYAPNRRTC